jgi:tetratricopeptide (TPR) repeat protein
MVRDRILLHSRYVIGGIDVYKVIDDRMQTYYRQGEYKEAMTFLDSLVPTNDDELGVILGHRALALYKQHPDNIPKSLLLLDRAMRMVRHLPGRMIRILCDATHFARYSKQFLRATKYVRIMQPYLSFSDPQVVGHMGIAYLNMGYLAMDTHDHAESERLFAETIRFYEKFRSQNPGDNHRCQLAIAKTMLCDVLCKTDRASQAEELLESIESSLTFDNDGQVVTKRRDVVLYAKGIVALAKKEYALSILHLNFAIEERIRDSYKDHNLMRLITASLVDAYVLSGLTDLLLGRLDELIQVMHELDYEDTVHRLQAMSGNIKGGVS